MLSADDLTQNVIFTNSDSFVNHIVHNVDEYIVVEFKPEFYDDKLNDTFLPVNLWKKDKYLITFLFPTSPITHQFRMFNSYECYKEYRKDLTSQLEECSDKTYWMSENNGDIIISYLKDMLDA